MTLWKPLAAMAALAGALSITLLAQQGPTFKSGTQIVSLFVTVTDPQRRLIPGLTKEDFEVFDNEKPQPLVYFDNSIRPINVVVMLDTSGSMTLTIDLLKQAAEQFLLRLLPEDKGRVGAFNDKIQFNAQVEQRSRSDGDRRQESGLRQRHEIMGRGGREPRRVEGHRRPQGDPALHRRRRHREQAAARHGDGPRPRRRSDGLRDRPREQYFMGTTTKPDGGLRKIAEETGGGYFELKRATDLAPTFTKVAQELHSQYVIGFAPTQLDNKVHKLSVKMKQPGMTAQARRSYLAAGDKMSVSGK